MITIDGARQIGVVPYLEGVLASIPALVAPLMRGSADYAKRLSVFDL